MLKKRVINKKNGDNGYKNVQKHEFAINGDKENKGNNDLES